LNFQEIISVLVEAFQEKHRRNLRAVWMKKFTEICNMAIGFY